MRYDNAEVTEELKEKLRIAKEQKKGLLIYGKTGTGKTYSLYAIKKTTDLNYRVENWVELMLEVRDKVSQGKEVGVIVRDLCESDVLAIDDLGAENQTPFSQEVLYTIVNRFYLHEKRMVIATNLDLRELAEKYGDRIFSRLVEMCELYEIKGEDKRLMPSPTPQVIDDRIEV
jgi:DNA replication protein DnaC